MKNTLKSPELLQKEQNYRVCKGLYESALKERNMGGRLHLHYGRRVPSGWDSETMKIDPLTFNEAGLLSV